VLTYVKAINYSQTPWKNKNIQRALANNMVKRGEKVKKIFRKLLKKQERE